VPDSLAVVADLECGATASYHFSTGAAGGPGSRIEIYGTRGALAYQLFVEEISGVSGDGTEWQTIPIPSEEAGSQTIDIDFVRAIRTGSPVFPDFAEGLRYMQFCEAVALSMKTGSRVSIAGLEPRMESWGRFLDVQDSTSAS
jgi:predicted dehydrogenase